MKYKYIYYILALIPLFFFACGEKDPEDNSEIQAWYLLLNQPDPEQSCLSGVQAGLECAADASATVNFLSSLEELFGETVSGSNEQICETLLTASAFQSPPHSAGAKHCHFHCMKEYWTSLAPCTGDTFPAATENIAPCSPENRQWQDECQNPQLSECLNNCFNRGTILFF